MVFCYTGYMKPYIPALALLFIASPACAQASFDNLKPFGLWLSEFEQEARAQGISQATLDDALSDTVPDDSVIELDRKQPESVLTLQEYLAKIVSPTRIENGKAMLAENRDLLEEIGKAYGVQPKFIVALWGIETSYGENTGNYEIIDALATLAYDGRRADFFRGELIKALRIVQQEHIAPGALQGSWAGAMGQCQFMPSSFLKYAVDYDHDGKHDIWDDKADIFASIANYLHSEGWDEHSDAQEDSENYNVLLKWNRSRYFATAVGALADSIGK